MKKKIYLIILAAFLITGCSKKDQMTNFIPTQAPEEGSSSGEETEVGSVEDTQEDVEPTPEVIYNGATTTKYVKLDEYGGYLNIRSKPSTEGEVIGFLVHAEEVEVIEVVDGWASILYNDKVYYVNASFLKEERPDYLTPPPPTPTPIVTPTIAPGTVGTSPEI